MYNINFTVNELYTEEKHFSTDSVTLAIYVITFNNNVSVEGNNITDTANHLVTIKLNYSTIVFQGFPEVVIMYPVGKK